MNQSARGFTIVELLIVIVVIAILAALSYVGYTTISDRANDSKMEDGAAQFIKALSLWSVDNGMPSGGGSGATLPLTNGRCPDGGGSGFVATTTYTCTIHDVLIDAGYLSRDYMEQLPANPYFGGSASGGLRSMMMYKCGFGSKVMVLWSLRNPSAEETANLHGVMTECGHSPTSQIVTSWGMRNARIVNF